MEEYKYVKSKEGRVVPRYGTGTLIGCKRKRPDKNTKSGHIWSTDIVRIPMAEWIRYIKEYTRAVKDKSLILVKKEEWEKEEQVRQDKQKKEAEASAKAEKKKKKGEKHPETK